MNHLKAMEVINSRVNKLYKLISECEYRKVNQTLERLVVQEKKEKRGNGVKHKERGHQNRKERLLKEKESIRQSICARCNGKLTLKRGKYGTFYGCSNFPKCRFTKKV